MPSRRKRKSLNAEERVSSKLQRVLSDLQSEDEFTRADAVRSLCPCRSAWGVPVGRYVTPMRDDPSSSVRHEVHHVMDEDSGLGRRLDARNVIAEETDPNALPGAHSLAWRKRKKPLQKGRYVAPLRELRLPLR